MKTPPFEKTEKASMWPGVLDRRGIPTHADGRLLTLTQRWALARKLSKQTK